MARVVGDKPPIVSYEHLLKSEPFRDQVCDDRIRGDFLCTVRALYRSPFLVTSMGAAGFEPATSCL